MNNLRKEAILTKLARHKPGHGSAAQLARKGEGWERASRITRYGGLGALGASFLTPAPTSGRLAASGIAAMLASLIASDIGRTKRGKARRKVLENMLAERRR